MKINDQVTTVFPGGQVRQGRVKKIDRKRFDITFNVMGWKYIENSADSLVERAAKDENITWTRGWHEPDSDVVRALFVAKALA